MLNIDSISKVFDKGGMNERAALDHVSLILNDGEFVTVIGGNGAGKSTLFNCIAGVYSIDTGNIELDSKNISFMPEYKRSKFIGRVFQDPVKGTAYAMSIKENLAIAYARNKRKDLTPGIRKNDINFFREQLSLLDLGLENRIDHKVGLLSGGQRQALTLLMATIVKPKLLLLDEHTAALDPSAAKKVLHLTQKIVTENKLTTIMITHNMKAALDYGTRTIMMNEGKIILDLHGKEREKMTVEGLIELFNDKSGTKLDNDRMLLG